MYRGDFAEAARHLAESLPLLRAVDAPVSELRNHMLLASTLDLLDRAREAAEHRDSAFAISQRIDTEATLVYWLGKALARAGDDRRATQLLEALEPRVREGATDRAALEGLRGEVLVARGQPEQGVLHLERAYGADRRSIVLESLAWAVTNAGAFERAAALYEDLARNRDFGWEGQLDARTALYHLGRVQEQRGDRAQAMLAYQRFLESWPATGVDILPVADARSRLAALRASERTPGG
jgi:tetratricopeptide (TPR) repeat protein